MATKEEVKMILEDLRKHNLKSEMLEFVKKTRGAYFVRVPKITSQFLGYGKGKKKAYQDAVLTIEEIERRWIG